MKTIELIVRINVSVDDSVDHSEIDGLSDLKLSGILVRMKAVPVKLNEYETLEVVSLE
jgi:hypothetical protein